MNVEDFFGLELFRIGSKIFTAGQLTWAVVSLVLVYFCYWFFSKKMLPRYFEREKIQTKNKSQVKNIIRYIFLFIALLLVIFSLKLNFDLIKSETLTIRIATIIEALLILQIARLLDWIFSKLLIYNYNQKREEESTLFQKKRNTKETETSELETEKQMELSGSRTTQYLVYVFAIILILQNTQFDRTLFHLTEDRAITVSGIFTALLIVLLARLIIWVLTQIVLYPYYRKQQINLGSRYAINQLLKYIIYVFAAFWALDILGIQPTVLWGGAAALLVGVGLGLQQTFNDFFSGIILLFERSVEVRDVIAIDGLVGTVKKIGLRTSVVETRDNITVVVPNSKLVTQNVINWSHEDDKARFNLNVGVAYGSDTALVKSLLIKVAKENIYVLGYPSPFVRFTDFGDSALLFELHFWSRNFIVIEDVKSDLRFEIDRLFRENEINIPFPQRDIWMKS